MQGDSVVAADQPDPQLCKGVGANCVKGLCEQYAVLLSLHLIFSTLVASTILS